MDIVKDSITMRIQLIIVVTDQNQYRGDDPFNFLAVRRRSCRLQSHPFGSTPISHIHGSSRIRSPKVNSNMSVRCLYRNVSISVVALVAADVGMIVSRCCLHDVLEGIITRDRRNLRACYFY
jgi:hypothetical protein